MASAPREEVPPADACVRLAERYGLDPQALDGWAVACNLTRQGARLLDPALRACAERLAAAAVLRRAARLVGPLRAATQVVRAPLVDPARGEPDLEETLANALGKPFPERDDWVMRRRVERRRQVVLMVDTSLSMSGENIALAAVATAALILRLRPEDVAVVAFEDDATTVTPLLRAEPPEEVVRRLLERPVRGYTNLAAALRQGAAELERGRDPRRCGLLITDGVATVGGDPLPFAHRFPRLHVLLTEDYKMDEAMCRRLAAAGHGSVVRVGSYAALPARVLDVAARLLR